MDNMESRIPEERKNSSEPVADKKPVTTKSSIKKAILAYLHDFVFWLAGILLIFTLLFRVVVVSGPSMKMTLLNGDYILLLSNIFYNDPEYGDIVVASKETYKDGEPIIKRVIATEGQEVDIDFANGVVYVDGVALDEPYTNTPTNLYEQTEFPQTVPEGCVFVMGDNRNNSLDSRSSEIGFIDCREILGRAIFILFPGADEDTKIRQFDRIGALS